MHRVLALNAVRVPLNEPAGSASTGAAAFSGQDYQKAHRRLRKPPAHKHRPHPDPRAALERRQARWLAIDSSRCPTWITRSTSGKRRQHVRGDDRAWCSSRTTSRSRTATSDTDAAWTCWRDGCMTTSRAVTSRPRACRSSSRHSGYRCQTTSSCSGACTSPAGSPGGLAYKPTDPTGNLAASWHVYNNKPCSDAACWNGPNLHARGGACRWWPPRSAKTSARRCVHQERDGLFLDQKQMGYLAWTWDAWGDCFFADRRLTRWYLRAPTDRHSRVTWGAM